MRQINGETTAARHQDYPAIWIRFSLSFSFFVVSLWKNSLSSADVDLDLYRGNRPDDLPSLHWFVYHYRSSSSIFSYYCAGAVHAQSSPSLARICIKHKSLCWLRDYRNAHQTRNDKAVTPRSIKVVDHRAQKEVGRRRNFGSWWQVERTATRVRHVTRQLVELPFIYTSTSLLLGPCN